MKKWLSAICLSSISTLFVNSFAGADTTADVHRIQIQWARANYQLTGDEQKKAFVALIDEVERLTGEQPRAAELWIWSGIVKSSYAGVKGGLGALSLAKQSRADLEKALALDAASLDGSAYTSLAALYSKVPSWPVGFGSDRKASDLFAKALAINPRGIDNNYFYAEFMFDEGHYDEAEKHYLLAQQAPARPDRPLADSGRQQEIAAGLKKVRQKLKH